MLATFIANEYTISLLSSFQLAGVTDTSSGKLLSLLVGVIRFIICLHIQTYIPDFLILC